MPPNDSSNYDRLIEQRLRLLEELTDASCQSGSAKCTHFVDLAGLDDSAAPSEITAPGDNTTDDLTDTATHHFSSSTGPITVAGTAMLGQCPECNAPLTIRTWLARADCWRCGTSIAVNELIINDAPESVADVPEGSRPSATLPKVAAPAQAVRPQAPQPPNDLPTNGHRKPNTENRTPCSELDALTVESFIAESIRRFFSLSPAWIVSLLLHLILLMILGLIVLGINNAPDAIVLSVDIGPDRHSGRGIQIDAGPGEHDDPAVNDQADDKVNDPADVPVNDPADVPVNDPAADKPPAPKPPTAPTPTSVLADQLTVDRSRLDAQRSDLPADVPTLSALDQVKSAVAGRTSATPFAARDPRLRSNVLRSEGGTLLTEAAVARGLKWLSSVQNADGSWSLKNYARHASKNNRGDCMGTAMALLPFLGAGQTHEWGIYQKTVAKGLNWMIRNQQPSGDLRAGLKTEAGMYAHGQAAIVLCEILAMTGDQQFLTPAQSAIDFIQAAQGPDGGWRYRPGQTGDTSMLGWQMMALQSAKLSRTNLQVDPQTLSGTGRFLDAMSVRRSTGFTADAPLGTFYCYQRNRSPTEAMTAEAILCRMYLGAKRNDPRVRSAVSWLMNKHFPSKNNKNVYYWYYGSQVMHHYGGRNWRNWNQRVQTLLLESQATEGPHAGSWARQGFRWGAQGGRIYTTAMAICTLEVYYRHLPLFRKISL